MKIETTQRHLRMLAHRAAGLPGEGAYTTSDKNAVEDLGRRIARAAEMGPVEVVTNG